MQCLRLCSWALSAFLSVTRRLFAVFVWETSGVGTDAGARENRRKVPTKVVVKAQLKPDLQDGTGSMPIGPVVLPECVCVCVFFASFGLSCWAIEGGLYCEIKGQSRWSISCLWARYKNRW